MIVEGKRLAQERTAAGIPTSITEGRQLAKDANEETKSYNQEVKAERKEQVETQRIYGEKASQALTDILLDATNEQKAIFRKIGENEAGKTKSEADFDRTIALEANKFKNTISSVKNDLSAPRSYNSFFRRMSGNEKDFSQASDDLRVKLKPLLDLGLYDTARNLLGDIVYYPEETESVINPINERVKSTIKRIPEAEKENLKEIKSQHAAMREEAQPIRYSPVEKNNLKEGILDVLKNDPNVSLVLLRKEFEDKNYDWRVFKDQLNSLIMNDEFKPNGDQLNQISHLDEAPLSNLGKILHGLNLIGR